MISINAQSASDTLSALKLQLAGITKLFDRDSRIFYLDYPVYNNVGDLLINIGTEQFFLDHDISIYRRYSVLDMPSDDQLETDDNTTFLFQGGGNFGDLYADHQGMRERLVEQFHHVRIVFLPQSLFYSSMEAQRESFEKIARHPNFHILARDKESLDALRDFGITDSSMMPDMAHMLWEEVAAISSGEEGREIYFLRQDREATAVPLELAKRFSSESVDWNNIVSLPHRIRARLAFYFLKTFGRITSTRLNTWLWYSTRDQMVADAVRYFSRHDRIYTNRLHAMLLGLILGRNVVAFDNSYGKLSRYINAWLLSASA